MFVAESICALKSLWDKITKYQHLTSGTSAHVGIKIYGSEAKSGARHLARMAAFQRNSEDSFLIASDRPLGNIQKIHLWHDNTGKHPSWFVSRVVVRDLQSNKKFFFLANCWLSLTVEQGSLDKQIHAASEYSGFGGMCFITEFFYFL